MLFNETKKTITLGDGRTIEISTGKMAKQADGAVVVKMGCCWVQWSPPETQNPM